MTLPNAVTALVTAQRRQQVPEDLVGARMRLSRADDKLAAARKIATIDIEIADVTAYDATRIAVTAHMLPKLTFADQRRIHTSIGTGRCW